MKKEKRVSIAYRIAFIVTGLIISIMAAADGIIYYEAYTNIYKINKSNMKVVSSEIYNNFKNLVSLQDNEAKNLSEDSYLRKIVTYNKNISTDEMSMLKNKLKGDSDKEVENIFFAGQL
ncbi:hypothetical protein DE169_001806 [Clostridium acetobutylicum]|nr:hypothetical protein [Clostridium acetobutylicum]